MKKSKKYIVLLLMSICILFCFIPRSNAVNNYKTNDNLELVKVVDFGDIKFLTINYVENEVYEGTEVFKYFYPGELCINTSKGAYVKNVSFYDIFEDKDEFSFVFNAPGKIESVYYNSERVNDARYYYLNIVPLICLSIAILLLIMTLIVYYIYRRDDWKTKIAGSVLVMSGIITLIYVVYTVTLKPLFGNFSGFDSIKKYWYLWIISIAAIALGQALRDKTPKRRNFETSSSYGMYLRKITTFNNTNQDLSLEVIQQKQLEEQNRLFQEQMQRDLEQIQRDMEQAQRDSQQFTDQQNQQNNDIFNSFNDFNNF